MGDISTDVLRLARAKLADMLASAQPDAAEYIRLRGEFIHSELDRRERKSGFGKFATSLGVALNRAEHDSAYLKRLTSWKHVAGFPEGRLP